jgi:hypothetical protein
MLLWDNAVTRRPWLAVALGVAFLSFFFSHLGPVRERQARARQAEAARWERVSGHGPRMTPEMLIPPPGTDPLWVEQQRAAQMHPDYAGEVERKFVFGYLWLFAFAGAWLLLVGGLALLSRRWAPRKWSWERRGRT